MQDDDVKEADVEMVVSIHNNMNERAWHKVLAWEAAHRDNRQHNTANGTSAPRLASFLGRPDELTPKAWLKSWLGYGTPFDRHDWVVDRDGTQVGEGEGEGCTRQVYNHHR